MSDALQRRHAAPLLPHHASHFEAVAQQAMVRVHADLVVLQAGQRRLEVEAIAPLAEMGRLLRFEQVLGVDHKFLAVLPRSYQAFHRDVVRLQAVEMHHHFQCDAAAGRELRWWRVDAMQADAGPRRINPLFPIGEFARLLNDPQRPVLLVFAGKAHPHDTPGQQLIKTIYEFSRRPEFEGKIVLLDGWWGEGYSGDNGWAITPHGPEYEASFRDREESNELLDILEKEIIPLYYQRNGHGYPEQWVKMSKASMKTLIPRFNAQRMLLDYVRRFYGPASRQ